MILADTSVWIDHLRRAIPELVAALEREEVVVHPIVIGELACGQLRDRGEVLALLAELPAAMAATDAEALHLIEEHRLMGRGIGYGDVHLLASAILSGARLWTRDKRLQVVAARLNVVP